MEEILCEGGTPLTDGPCIRCGRLPSQSCGRPKPNPIHAELKALKAENERLKRYIQDDWEHSDMCASHDLLGAATDNCNCGLRETLKALAGKEAG